MVGIVSGVLVGVSTIVGGASGREEAVGIAVLNTTSFASGACINLHERTINSSARRKYLTIVLSNFHNCLLAKLCDCFISSTFEVDSGLRLRRLSG